MPLQLSASGVGASHGAKPSSVQARTAVHVPKSLVTEHSVPKPSSMACAEHSQRPLSSTHCVVLPPLMEVDAWQMKPDGQSASTSQLAPQKPPSPS